MPRPLTPNSPQQSDEERLNWLLLNPLCAQFFFSLVVEEPDLERRKLRVRYTIDDNIAQGLRDVPNVEPQEG